MFAAKQPSRNTRWNRIAICQILYRIVKVLSSPTKVVDKMLLPIFPMLYALCDFADASSSSSKSRGFLPKILAIQILIS